MVSSPAKTVEEYLQSLPDERRTVIKTVRAVILANLPEGYVETMNWGMISYEIPLATYPNTYNGKALSYAALAAQKNSYSLYLMAVYAVPALQQQLQAAFAAAGKRLDMGKSCLRFKKLDDLPLEAIGNFIAAVPLEKYLQVYEQSRPH